MTVPAVTITPAGITATDNCTIVSITYQDLALPE